MSALDKLHEEQANLVAWGRDIIDYFPEVVGIQLDNKPPSRLSLLEVADLVPDQQYREVCSRYLKVLDELLNTIPVTAPYLDQYTDYCLQKGFIRNFRTRTLTKPPKPLKSYKAFEHKQLARLVGVADEDSQATQVDPVSSGEETVDPGSSGEETVDPNSPREETVDLDEEIGAWQSAPIPQSPLTDTQIFYEDSINAQEAYEIQSQSQSQSQVYIGDTPIGELSPGQINAGIVREFDGFDDYPVHEFIPDYLGSVSDYQPEDEDMTTDDPPASLSDLDTLRQTVLRHSIVTDPIRTPVEATAWLAVQNGTALSQEIPAPVAPLASSSAGPIRRRGRTQDTTPSVARLQTQPYNITPKNAWYYLGSGPEFWATGYKIGNQIQVAASRGYREWDDRVPIESLNRGFITNQMVSMDGWINTEVSNPVYKSIQEKIYRSRYLKYILYGIYSSEKSLPLLGIGQRNMLGQLVLMHRTFDGQALDGPLNVNTAIPENFYAQPMSGSIALSHLNLSDAVQFTIRHGAFATSIPQDISTDKSLVFNTKWALQTYGFIVTSKDLSDVFRTCPHTQWASQDKGVYIKRGPTIIVTAQKGYTVAKIQSSQVGNSPWVRIFTNSGTEPWSMFMEDGSRVVVAPNSSLISDPNKSISIPVLEIDTLDTAHVTPALLEWISDSGVHADVIDTGMNEWLGAIGQDPSFRRDRSPEISPSIISMDIDIPRV